MVLLSLSWARWGQVISLPWPHGLGNWPHDIVSLITGEGNGLPFQLHGGVRLGLIEVR